MCLTMETVNLTTEVVVIIERTDIKNIHSELEKFGLSPNQTRIYLLLVAQGELRIQEIVRLAGIPRSSVYECLKKLYELGIAEEIVGDNYKKVRPYSVGAMRHGLDEKMIELKRLITDLDELEKSIELTPWENAHSLTAVRYYKGRSGARQLYWNTLKAKNTVYVYSDWGRGRYVGMKFYENFVEQSRQRQIKERVLITPTASALESIRTYTYPGSPISRTRLEDIRAVDKHVLIRGDTLIYDNVYAHVYLKNVEINGFEVESGQFVETQRSIFETLWETATPITALL